MATLASRALPRRPAFLRRRLRGALLTALVLAVVLLADRAHVLRLGHPSAVSGWGLLTACLLLTSFNLRKKLSFLPLGAASTWLQLHAWLGLLSLALFGLHLGLRRPSGLLEGSLAACFLGVGASGVFGLYVTRVFPHRLRTRGEEPIFERIPALRRRIQLRAEELVERAATERRSVAIPDLYLRSLAPFLSGHQHRLGHLMERRGHFQTLEARLADTRRVLGPEDQAILDELAQLVRSKEDLDYHASHQGLLKLWLFVHIPLTWALLPLAALHVVTVLAFGAGA